MSTPERYTLLSHKMQAGVAHDQATDPRKAGLHLEANIALANHIKHERVGINAARVETGTLMKLLIDKGVFTEDEWWTEACRMMEREIEKYEAILTARLGFSVTLDTPFLDPSTGERRV